MRGYGPTFTFIENSHLSKETDKGSMLLKCKKTLKKQNIYTAKSKLNRAIYY